MNDKLTAPFIAANLFLSVVFGVTHAQSIDDFESYASTPALTAAWTFATALDGVTPTNGGGIQTMRREGATVSPGGGVSVFRDFAAMDLTGETLFVWFRTDPSSVPLSARLTIRDGMDQPCTDQDVLTPISTTWTLLSLDTSVRCASVDLTNIVRIQINVTNSGLMVGDIVVNIDDVSLDGSVPVELTTFEVD